MKSIISILFILLASYAHAAENLLHFKIYDEEGHASKISIHPYFNQVGTLEVRVDAASIPKLFDKLNPTIAYGRDLNHNQKIDTWFFITTHGIEVVEKEGTDHYGRDILGDLVNKRYKTSAKTYLTSATTTALSYLFFTVDEIADENRNFYYDWMNLEELNLLITKEEQNPKLGLNYQQIMSQRELISIGFKELANRMDKLKNRDIVGYIALDIGAWLTGGVVLKWGGKLLATPIKMLSETTLVKFITENISQFVVVQQEELMTKVANLKEKFPTKNAKEKITITTSIISKNLWRSQLSMSIKAFHLKTKIFNFSKGVFNGAKAEWKYLALNASIQTGAEAFARYDQIKDENPLKMAENLLTNKDFQQNVGFMTLDTVLMTGLSRNLKTTKAKFAACGMVALHNSSVINFVVKDENDYKRVALDTSWEMIIGNAQVQMDLAALTFFEKLAQKKNNPKLRLLGYAFVMVDQAAGYFSYSKASEMIDKKPNPEPQKMLMPILAETN